MTHIEPISVGELLHQPLIDINGVAVGRVTDILIGDGEGAAAYWVVIPNSGDESITLRWDVIHPDAARNCLRLAVPGHALTSALKASNHHQKH